MRVPNPNLASPSLAATQTGSFHSLTCTIIVVVAVIVIIGIGVVFGGGGTVMKKEGDEEGDDEGITRSSGPKPRNPTWQAGGVVSGMRGDSKVAVWVDVRRGVKEGVPFYVSANRVVLTPGEGDTGCVPPRLFLRAHYLPGVEPLPLQAGLQR